MFGNIVGVLVEGIVDGLVIECYVWDMMDVINSFGGDSWVFLGFLYGFVFFIKVGEIEL